MTNVREYIYPHYAAMKCQLFHGLLLLGNDFVGGLDSLGEAVLCLQHGLERFEQHGSSRNVQGEEGRGIVGISWPRVSYILSTFEV